MICAPSGRNAPPEWLSASHTIRVCGHISYQDKGFDQIGLSMLCQLTSDKIALRMQAADTLLRAQASLYSPLGHSVVRV
jgi:hypothetical protein